MAKNGSEFFLIGIKGIVIETETGRRKGKSLSQPELVCNPTEQAHVWRIPGFMKACLLPIMGDAQMIQELSEAFCRVLEEQKAWNKQQRTTL
nr:hypothetical protein [uncultured Agathobaculum sp.]